jgi:hypothetical protein
VFDDSRVYGFGRKPQYYRWTTPIEHHLFAADKTLPASSDAGSEQSLIRIEKSTSLNPAGKPLTVEAWVKAERSRGVILARGGSVHGYALYLQGGRPAFAVRIDGNSASVRGTQKVIGRWVHLVGVLTETKELQIYVDGMLAGSVTTARLIAADPAEAMQIGADEGTSVGNYTGPSALKGLIDEVRVYHRALSGTEIRKRASSAGQANMKDTNLVLWFSFDKGDAADRSGYKNNGSVEGAKAVKGKVGRAMRFTGKAGSTSGFLVEHHWSRDVPLLVRAMVLSGGHLFIAGPPDLIDEEQAFQHIEQVNVQRNLASQAAALQGKSGGVLWVVSTTDGEKSAEYDLSSPPVFDGMAAAGERLYLTTVQGSLQCKAFPGR